MDPPALISCRQHLCHNQHVNGYQRRDNYDLYRFCQCNCDTIFGSEQHPLRKRVGQECHHQGSGDFQQADVIHSVRSRDLCAPDLLARPLPPNRFPPNLVVQKRALLLDCRRITVGRPDKKRRPAWRLSLPTALLKSQAFRSPFRRKVLLGFYPGSQCMFNHPEIGVNVSGPDAADLCTNASSRHPERRE